MYSLLGVLKPHWSVSGCDQMCCSHVFMCICLSATGTLNALLKQKGQTTSEAPAWSLNGNQGERWKQAKVSIHPTSSFQVRQRNIINPIRRCTPLVALYLLLWLRLCVEGSVSLGAAYWYSTSQAVMLSREVDTVCNWKTQYHVLRSRRLIVACWEYSPSCLWLQLWKVIIVSAARLFPFLFSPL